MFDTVDACLFYPSRNHAYFFKGDKYIKYRRNHGVVQLSGREMRRTGIDGWRSFPAEFRSDLSAALYYPPNGHAYFFKEDAYIKYKPDEGVVPLANGRTIRRLGEDGWTSFPDAFARGIDAAMFYPANWHAYFFKGDRYIKYKPDEGVVRKDGRKTRTIGEDGWYLPDDFPDGIDEAMDYLPNGKIYFFRGRNYVRYEPRDGVDPRYPRRFGLLHADNGGWPGLSHVVSGPLVGGTTDTTARLWLWVTDSATADALTVEVDGAAANVVCIDATYAEVASAADWINQGSRMCVLDVSGLAPATRYTASVRLAGDELDRVVFVTAPRPSTEGVVQFGVGSCSNMSAHRDVPAFEPMADAGLDFALFLGDNCYYYNADGNSYTSGSRPFDWESTDRMLLRQIVARNHPEFARISRGVPCYATWDDHDFGANNAQGSQLVDDWVGREVAGAVFRAMWPNPYLLTRTDEPIYFSYRWGPVEVFVTDNRFERDTVAGVIWGQEQLAWLLDALAKSDAVVKVVATSGQFLFNKDDQEGHAEQATDERSAFVDAVLGTDNEAATVTGRVLLVSGDVHYSELIRLERGEATLLEFTSSPLRRDLDDDDPPGEKAPGVRVWAARKNGFGVIRVDAQTSRQGEPSGTITIEARDDEGDLIRRGGRDCRSRWDIATGDLT